MSDTTSRVPGSRLGYDEPIGRSDHRTGWTGWVVFAAVMMIVIGAFQVIEGLTALFRDTYYVVGHDDLLLRVDYTGWGWIHLGIGAVLVISGLGLFSGAMWARVVGVTVAALSALANLVFIAAYPVWAITVIALDVFVIYAITVHGREMRLRT
jgi:hypothetical protein